MSFRLSRKFHFPLLPVILSILLAGCQPNSGGQSSVGLFQKPPSETPTITATSTATPTNTSTPTPTCTPTLEPTPTPKEAPFFDQFVASLTNGNSWQVVGVYVEGLMAFQVVQQPDSNPGYVSTQNNVVTYFTLVYRMTGNTGLLAHNYLAGIYYYELAPGQMVTLIFGDGRTEDYVVQVSQEYQALSPSSPTSNFVDLYSGETLSSTDLFYRVYSGSSRTTFQTCIAQGSEDSWGRLFVIAPQE